jgi:hypothetical protein
VSNPDIFSKLEVPKACPILSAAAGFSQTTRAYGGSGILLKIKPIVSCNIDNITSKVIVPYS